MTANRTNMLESFDYGVANNAIFLFPSPGLIQQALDLEKIKFYTYLLCFEEEGDNTAEYLKGKGFKRFDVINTSEISFHEFFVWGGLSEPHWEMCKEISDYDKENGFDIVYLNYHEQLTNGILTEIEGLFSEIRDPYNSGRFTRKKQLSANGILYFKFLMPNKRSNNATWYHSENELQRYLDLKNEERFKGYLEIKHTDTTLSYEERHVIYSGKKVQAIKDFLDDIKKDDRFYTPDDTYKVQYSAAHTCFSILERMKLSIASLCWYSQLCFSVSFVIKPKNERKV